MERGISDRLHRQRAPVPAGRDRKRRRGRKEGRRRGFLMSSDFAGKLGLEKRNIQGGGCVCDFSAEFDV